jgi:hypothetical protein
MEAILHSIGIETGVCDAKTTKHKVARAFLGVIFVALSMVTPGTVYGQQEEIPPAPPKNNTVAADPASTSPEASETS